MSTLLLGGNECNYKQSVAWLHERFGSDITQRAAAHYAREQVSSIVKSEPTQEFVPPPCLEKNWLSVHNYLTQKRGLPHALVQAAHDEGLIYASDHQNAVFLMRSLSAVASPCDQTLVYMWRSCLRGLALGCFLWLFLWVVQ